MRRARITTIVGTWGGRIGHDVTKNTLVIRTREPSVWARKYFKAASVSRGFLFIVSMGMRARRLISSPTQALNQELEEILNKEPETNKLKNMNCHGMTINRRGNIFIFGLWAQ